jgi:hypothetical protein
MAHMQHGLIGRVWVAIDRFELVGEQSTNKKKRSVCVMRRVSVGRIQTRAVAVSKISGETASAAQQRLCVQPIQSFFPLCLLLVGVRSIRALIQTQSPESMETGAARHFDSCWGGGTPPPPKFEMKQWAARCACVCVSPPEPAFKDRLEPRHAWNKPPD